MFNTEKCKSRFGHTQFLDPEPAVDFEVSPYEALAQLAETGSPSESAGTVLVDLRTRAEHRLSRPRYF